MPALLRSQPSCSSTSRMSPRQRRRRSCVAMIKVPTAPTLGCTQTQLLKHNEPLWYSRRHPYLPGMLGERRRPDRPSLTKGPGLLGSAPKVSHALTASPTGQGAVTVTTAEPHSLQTHSPPSSGWTLSVKGGDQVSHMLHFADGETEPKKGSMPTRGPRLWGPRETVRGRKSRSVVVLVPQRGGGVTSFGRSVLSKDSGPVLVCVFV